MVSKSALHLLCALGLRATFAVLLAGGSPLVLATTVEAPVARAGGGTKLICQQAKAAPAELANVLSEDLRSARELGYPESDTKVCFSREHRTKGYSFRVAHISTPGQSITAEDSLLIVWKEEGYYWLKGETEVSHRPDKTIQISAAPCNGCLKIQINGQVIRGEFSNPVTFSKKIGLRVQYVQGPGSLTPKQKDIALRLYPIIQSATQSVLNTPASHRCEALSKAFAINRLATECALASERFALRPVKVLVSVSSEEDHEDGLASYTFLTYFSDVRGQVKEASSVSITWPDRRLSVQTPGDFPSLKNKRLGR